MPKNTEETRDEHLPMILHYDIVEGKSKHDLEIKQLKLLKI